MVLKLLYIFAEEEEESWCQGMKMCKFFNMVGTDVKKICKGEFKLFSHGHFKNI